MDYQKGEIIDLTIQLVARYELRPKTIGRYGVSDLYAIVKGYLTVEEFVHPSALTPLGAYGLWNGGWRHRQVQDLLEGMYELEPKREREVAEGVVVVGKADGLNEDHVLEIKTTRDGLLLRSAKESHEFQARCYATLFERSRAIVVQPLITDGYRPSLRVIGEVRRDDEWFNRQIVKLIDFHARLVKLPV